MNREQLIDFFMNKYGCERWVATAFADAQCDEDEDDEDDSLAA